VPIRRDICIYCSRASYLGLTHALCKRTNGIDGLIAIYYYNPILKKIIKNIKYRLVSVGLVELLKIANTDNFMKLLFYKKINKSLYVQPIPLHQKRERQRGFNQSEIIAEYVVSALGISQSDVLVRMKETTSQAQLPDRKSRYLNIRGAFAIKKSNNHYTIPQSIILVDDVVTSGSTVKEAGRILKQSGVEKIYILSLAKG